MTEATDAVRVAQIMLRLERLERVIANLEQAKGGIATSTPIIDAGFTAALGDLLATVADLPGRLAINGVVLVYDYVNGWAKRLSSISLLALFTCQGSGVFRRNQDGIEITVSESFMVGCPTCAAGTPVFAFLDRLDRWWVLNPLVGP